VHLERKSYRLSLNAARPVEEAFCTRRAHHTSSTMSRDAEAAFRGPQVCPPPLVLGALSSVLLSSPPLRSRRWYSRADPCLVH